MAAMNIRTTTAAAHPPIIPPSEAPPGPEPSLLAIEVGVELLKAEPTV